MCGNFGLLFIKNQTGNDNTEPESDLHTDRQPFAPSPKPANKNGFSALDAEDASSSQRRVSFKTVGFAQETDALDAEEEATAQATKNDALKNPLQILEAQAANTEIRGGQAGGYSSLEYSKVKNTSPLALHPVGEDMSSPFASSHSVGSSNHSRIAGIMAAKTAKLTQAQAQPHSPAHSPIHQQSHSAMPRSGTKSSDVQSPLHGSNHDSVHSQMRPRALSQDGSVNFAPFEAEYVTVPTNTRVRTVARKRYPLATDLSNQFLKARMGKTMALDNTFTVIAHTRFATSSANIVTELHPHEWTPFKKEVVWRFNSIIGKFERSSCTMGVHITHNGDFDEMEAYQQVLVNEEIGYWLARILYSHNPARSDSAKIAGVMELFRVQGRWGPAARLAWVRCVLSSATDVSGGMILTSDAPYSFPPPGFWTNWAIFLEEQWALHINNIISPVIAPLGHTLAGKMFFYKIHEAGVVQLENTMVGILSQENHKATQTLGVKNWTEMKLKSFIHHAVRGFLKMDLYNAVTEMIGRAEGSFGLQVHCTLEPGVVLVASKGQPMSIAFDHDTPLVLFASEAEALNVSVRESGKSLPYRIDLDGHGEIVRVGEPRALLEGHFRDKEERAADATSGSNVGSSGGISGEGKEGGKGEYPRGKTGAVPAHRDGTSNNLLKSQQCLYLRCGVEIRSYLLNRYAELNPSQLEERCVEIAAAKVPYDPYADLVVSDLADTPAVLNAIDKAWNDRTSPQRTAGHALSVKLVDCMRRRLKYNQDSVDLLITGVEASLWLAEQFASDLRRIFPYLNVVTISANKVLGLGDDDSSKVFFPTTVDHLERRITPDTCVLLISQSGQTFSTLHATHKLANIVYDRLWILTGCTNSKMEFALTDSYRRHNLTYKHDRVIHNRSGHRPAEPTSVAVAAAWHSLTCLMMHLIYTTRALIPSGRIVHDWVYQRSARIIQTFFRRHNCEMRIRNRRNTMTEMELSVVSYKYTPPVMMMRLTDGCIRDLNSLLVTNLIPNVCSIVGRDIKGKLLDSNEVQSVSAHPSNIAAAASTATSNLTDILTGKERHHSIHSQLRKLGHTWAAHIAEPWMALVLSSCYILISVGFNLPVCGLVGDLIVLILRKMGAPLGQGQLSFSLRYPNTITDLYAGWVVCGLLLQLCDALVLIYIGKYIVQCMRLIQNRPFYARAGKRTIVIVDSPTVHQLLENFVSKLYSQSYSMVSVEVHGASGLDHFVHRFTHRVTRGVLIAVGRVDGRLCCLAKSEASTLLAVKQAAFIRNPEYPGASSGPDIITIGHNPFVPNVGVAHHVVLNSVTTVTPMDHRPSKVSLSRLLKVDAARTRSSSNTNNTAGSTSEKDKDQEKVELAVLKSTHTEWKRYRFLDMYLYNRLYFAEKPFTTAILKSLRFSMEYELELRRLEDQKQLKKGQAPQNKGPFSPIAGSGVASLAVASMNRKGRAMKQHLALSSEILPYGVHHIDPSMIMATNRDNTDSSFLEFFMHNTSILRKMKHSKKKDHVIRNKSSDPALVLAFNAKLDDNTKKFIDRQVYVQQFYECRIAALERYLAFCVVFHAMAESNSRPWLSKAWNISRSQSNLRVATTASPISASTSQSHDGPEISRAVLGKSRKAIGTLTRKVHTNF